MYLSAICTLSTTSRSPPLHIPCARILYTRRCITFLFLFCALIAPIIAQDVDLSSNLVATGKGFRILGAAADDQSGWSVSAAGDVNGDGVDDIIIGANLADPPGKFNAGITYVIFGRNTANEETSFVDIQLTTGSMPMPDAIGFRILGAAANDQSGISVSSAGDVNGDGIDDVIVGAHGADSPGKVDAGTTYVIFGRNITQDTAPFGDIQLLTTAMAVNVGFRIIGATAGDLNGFSVCKAGDVNGDGIDDVITGSYLADTPAGVTDAGISYVIFGRNLNGGAVPFGDIQLTTSALSPNVGFRILGAAVFDVNGFSVSDAGDVNGDGICDIITGAHRADPANRADAGISYVIFGRNIPGGATPFGDIQLTAGSTTLSPDIGFRILGAAVDDWSGVPVCSAGDLNGDGIGDIMIGAINADPTSGLNAGISYVIFGRNVGEGAAAFGDIQLTAGVTTMPANIGFRILGAAAGDNSGWFVSAAGDVNGDGIDDVIVGAPLVDSFPRLDAGTSYVIYGRDTAGGAAPFGDIQLTTGITILPPNIGFRIVGAGAGDNSGFPASYAGDINGDGVDDVIVGARYADPPSGLNAGISYVIFGVDLRPTSLPSSQPSRQPSRQPSAQPSRQPSRQPSGQPTGHPSGQPMALPTSQPSRQPSRQPTGQPTIVPTTQPTTQPSRLPSAQPSSTPSGQPSTQPTYQPSVQPFSQPSMQPSSEPSRQPSSQPSTQATAQPTSQPSAIPTSQPSRQPSTQPSAQPVLLPTAQPSGSPSSQPSLQSFASPTSQPSRQPSRQPSTQPSSQPSNGPSAPPSSLPSVLPSVQPSNKPSAQPSARPSMQPSTQPSNQPSVQPSTQSTSKPSIQPTSQPSRRPGAWPSSQPSDNPSVLPSSQPSMQPSNRPSALPSSGPSAQPTSQPSVKPSVQPSNRPSAQFSEVPSTQPTIQPSAQPMGRPTAQPSCTPSSQPTGRPSNQPSMQSSSQPFGQPISTPSSPPMTSPTNKARTGEWIGVVGNLSEVSSGIAFVNNSIWACGVPNNDIKELYCSLIDQVTGNPLNLYSFPWRELEVTSITRGRDASSVAISGSTARFRTTASEVAMCELGAAHLTCSAMSFEDTIIVAGSYAPVVDKMVYIGTYNTLALVLTTNIAASSAVTHSYMYLSTVMQTVTFSHIQSPPNFVGSFVVGTCVSSGLPNNIFAGMVRSDSGVMTAMYIAPMSGSIANSAELVNAMELEYTNPDSFIAGGLQLTGDENMHAYLLCVNSIYRKVVYGVRYIRQDAESGDRRRAQVNQNTENGASVVKGMVRVDSFLYLIVAYQEFQSRESIAVLKTDMATGNILQQVQIYSPYAGLECTNIVSSGLSLVIACSVQYSGSNNTQIILLSVSKDLAFSHLPVDFLRNENATFAAEPIAFKRTLLPMSVTNLQRRPVEYTFNSADGQPSRLPSVAPTLVPTSQPSCAPSGQPSSSPSAAPSVSPQPTSRPSSSGPTNTYKPTIKPTQQPSRVPSRVPTVLPTVKPTATPTARPSAKPSPLPSTQPSAASTMKPTCTPTAKPTRLPSLHPSPTREPTAAATTILVVGAVGKASNKADDVVMIVAYVLAGVTGLWATYQLLKCCVQAEHSYKRKQKLRAELDNIHRSMPATQPPRTSHPDTDTVQNRHTGAYATIPTNTVGGRFNGAYATGAPNGPITVTSSSDSSIVVSSLHSSEMSDISYSVYSEGSYPDEYNSYSECTQNSENNMEEGRKVERGEGAYENSDSGKSFDNISEHSAASDEHIYSVNNDSIKDSLGEESTRCTGNIAGNVDSSSGASSHNGDNICNGSEGDFSSDANTGIYSS